MSMSTLTEGINLVRISTDLKLTILKLNDINITPKLISEQIELSIIEQNIEFTNDSAKVSFESLVLREIDRVYYNEAYPKIGLDKSGNYTYDESKWA